MPVADQTVVERAQAAVRALARVAPKLPAVVHQMRADQAGQPRAAATHRAGDDVDGDADRRRRWCSTHERALHMCDPADRSCSIDPDRDISDPTGQAAVGHDRAAVHERRLLKALEQLTSATLQVIALAEAYPTESVEREQLGPDAEVGTVWCRCCWKDEKYCEPIPVRTSGRSVGKPYYPGLCRWCGRMRTELGFDPPSWLVAKHHQGEAITEPMLAQAIAERPVSTESRSSKGKKGKKRK